MKPILSLKTWLAVCLFAVSSTCFASIWAPTDGGSNFLSLTTASFPSPSTDVFGIFDDNADLNNDSPVVKFKGVGDVVFTPNGSNFNVSAGSFSGQLSGSNYFQIAWLSGSVWKAAVKVTGSATGYELVFANTTTPSKADSHFLYAFDIRPVVPSSGTPAAVPLPASVWMMTSALLGLLYTGRRKAAVSV